MREYYIAVAEWRGDLRSGRGAVRTGYDDEMDDESRGREGNGDDATYGSRESAMEGDTATVQMYCVIHVSKMSYVIARTGKCMAGEECSLHGRRETPNLAR